MSVKDEQEYIVVRERTHRNTAESTNDRVKWWSVAQVIILFVVVAWQVYYLQVCTCVVSFDLYSARLCSRSLRSSELSERVSLVIFRTYIYTLCKTKLTELTSTSLENRAHRL